MKTLAWLVLWTVRVGVGLALAGVVVCAGLLHGFTYAQMAGIIGSTMVSLALVYFANRAYDWAKQVLRK